MENINLIEIRKNVAALPVLKEKKQILQNKIREAEENVGRLLDKYKAESLDVEKLEKDSLRTLLLKNFGRYEEKLDKESDEMLTAKLEYDKACMRVKELETVKGETENRISSLLNDKRIIEDELKRREAAVKSDMNSEISIKYRELETEQDSLAKCLVETEEAKNAARRALSTAGSAMEHLGSAENWATFDVWTRGGIISHIAKYKHIDNAEEDFYRLNSQLQDLQKELADLNLTGVTNIDGIDSATRTVDFWFDNIFTDMNVRSRIRDDYDSMSELRDKISSIVYKLGNDITDIQNKLNELEQKKDDLLVNGG